MRSILLASAAFLALTPATMAQNAGTASQPNAAQNQSAINQSVQPQHLRANLRNALEKAGYKDIRVAPTSFMVHAKDTDGNPVVMAISPDSFTEVADVNDSGNSGSTPSTTGTVNSNNASGAFVSVPQADELSSKVIGLDIYNNDNKDIGQIKDIALNPNGRSQAYIVSVGGFLGMGEHYVAVNPQAVKVTYNDQDKKWHATMNATADQLKSAPEFKYAGRWQSNRT
jgi:sporulation protein YlmC with PRC-barrel domain/DNA-binding transcriptional regulator YdaS (Cro superfamily)